MKKNNKKGFTLVELVIVVAVMAILVAVAIPTVSSISKSATDSVNNSNARTIESMIKLAEADKAKAGDGAGSLSATEVDAALTKAKLGIDKDATFLYNTVSGAVTYKSGAAASATEMVITFDADGTVNANPATDSTIVVTPCTAGGGGNSEASGS